MAGSRISKVTTKSGDTGKTKLATGRTVPKHAPIIRAIGAVDELNSHLGVLINHVKPTDADKLSAIQQQLFDMGAVFAMEGKFQTPSYDALEADTEAMNAALPPLTEFVLPGGGDAAAQAHVSRSVCRRVEIDLWVLVDSLADDDEEAAANFTQCAQYLNRLSDYLFVLARTYTDASQAQWQGPQA